MNELRTPTMEYVIGPQGSFRLHVRSSDVHLQAHDEDTVRVRTRDGSDLRRLEAESADGALTMRADGGAPDLMILVPTAAAIFLEAGSGDVHADGLRGTQRYQTASGDIELRGVGGHLTVEAVSGDVDIVAGAPAEVAARTVSGDLGLRAGPIRVLRATTTSGDLRVAGRFDGDGPFALETVSGDATLASAGGLRIEVATITGDLRLDADARAEGPRGQRTIIVGDGGPRMTFRSTSGDLRVVRAAALGAGDATALPEPPAPPAAPEAPYPPTPTAPTPPDARDDPGMTILQALERGEIDVTEAARRLEELEIAADDAGGPTDDPEADRAG